MKSSRERCSVYGKLWPVQDMDVTFGSNMGPIEISEYTCKECVRKTWVKGRNEGELINPVFLELFPEIAKTMPEIQAAISNNKDNDKKEVKKEE